MADDTDYKKMFDTAMTRISALETELRAKPKAVEAPAAPAFDVYKFREALAIDPVGTMRAMQMSPEHINHVYTVLEAARLGDAAPPHLKAIAMQGPQMMAAQATNEAVAMLSRRLDDREKSEQKASKRESFKTIAANKDKYPNLTKALAADPSIIDEVDSHGGTAEEFAAAQEARLTKLFGVATPPPASVNADKWDPSLKVKPTPLASNLNGEVPPITQTKPGSWTREEYAKLRDSIVQKVSSPKV